MYKPRLVDLLTRVNIFVFLDKDVMKGVAAKFLGIMAIVAIIAIISLYITIQVQLTETEAPLRGMITAVFGFLPKVCATIASPECTYCLITQKLVPLISNTILTIALITVAFSTLGQISRETLPSMYAAISIMSLGIGILSVHFNPDFIGSGLFGVAALTLALNLLGIVGLPGRFTNFLILAVIMSVLISGTHVLWISLIPVRIVAALFFRWVSFPEWDGIGAFIVNNLGLPQTECGDFTLGPESFT